VNGSVKQDFVRTSSLCDSFAEFRELPVISKCHGFWMRFDKEALSNLIKAFLTSRCHQSKILINLNNVKNILRIQYQRFLAKVIRAGGDVRL
jgi:hypothetical protein